MLASGAESIIAQEGSTATIGGKSVQVGRITTDGKVRLAVGDEAELVSVGEIVDFDEDFTLSVRSISSFESGGGEIQLDYDADRIVLDEAATTGNTVKVKIEGRDKSLPVTFKAGGTGSGDTYTLPWFSLEFSTGNTDDSAYFIREDQGLKTVDSEGNSFLEEGVDSLLGDLNLVYSGLSEESTQDVVFDHSDGGKQYEMSFVDGNGNTVPVPLVYSDEDANAATEPSKIFKLGTEDSTLVITGWDTTDLDSGTGDIGLDDYFLISSQDKAQSFLFELVTAEYNSEDGGNFVIRDVGSGKPFTIKTGTLTANIAKQDREVRIFGDNYVFGARIDTADSDKPYLALETAQNTVYLSNEQSIGLTASTNIDQSQGSSAKAKTVVAVLNTGSDLTDDLDASSVTLTLGATLASSSDAASGKKLSLTLTNDGSLVENPEDKDFRTGYTSFGTFIRLDKSSDNGNVVTLTTPDKQIRPWVVLEGAAGASSVVSTGDSGTSVATARPASSVGNYQDFNTILVGGPCVNPFAAQALGSSGECTDGFDDGSAIIQYVEHTNGNVALVVAGYSASDTTRAVNVLTQSTRDEGLTGTKVTVTPNPSGSGVVVSPAQ